MNRNVNLIWIYLIACLLPASVNAQAPGAAEAELNAEYKGKVFLLRGFYAGKEIGFDENGNISSGNAVGSWTVAKVVIAKIAILPNVMEIKGERIGSEFTHREPRDTKAGNITIRVARSKSATDDPLVIARKQISAIFMDPSTDVCPILPDIWKLYCSGTDPKAKGSAWSEILTTNHLAPYNSPNKPPSVPKVPVTAPKILDAPDPRYSDAAKTNHTEGTTVLLLVVDETGRPAAITISRPVGMGLDEEAVRAVSRWQFRPASHDGNPVPVQINVEVNFRCCP